MAQIDSPFYEDLVRVGHILPLSSLNGKNVLVTGATGLIGSAVVKLLLLHEALDIKIFASSRSMTKLKTIFNDFLRDDRLKLVAMDVTRPIKMTEQFNYIVDCASLGNPKAFRESPVDIIRSNIEGIVNLAEYGIGNGLEKILYVSSGEVYGEGDGKDFIEEYSGYVNPTEIRSCYPASKRAAESLCIGYASQYGVKVSIARPCHVFGPNFTDSDDRAFAQFFRNIIAGENIVLKSSGSQVRSWIYVVDCAAAILYILLKGENMSAYNISNIDESISIREFAGLIAQNGNSDLKLELSDESIKNAVITRAVLSAEKLWLLGWKNLFTINEGIKRTILQLNMNIAKL